MTDQTAELVPIQELTVQQQHAVALLASGMAPKETAAEVGVAWGTIRNWSSAHGPFRAELHRLRREAHRHAQSAIYGLAESAVSTLRQLLFDPAVAPREKIAACNAVLRYSMPAHATVTHTPEDAAQQIAEILNRLEDFDGIDYPT
ncbi:MAG: hypothetical protein RIC56_03045 [Pseudomonadales bacterium]